MPSKLTGILYQGRSERNWYERSWSMARIGTRSCRRSLGWAGLPNSSCHNRCSSGRLILGNCSSVFVHLSLISIGPLQAAKGHSSLIPLPLWLADQSSELWRENAKSVVIPSNRLKWTGLMP